MRKLSLKPIGIFLLAAILGGLLFQTSQNVQQSEDELGALNAQIEAERETIEVLKTEWEYLNRPQRLEELARKQLKMHTPSSAEILENAEDLPSMAPKGFEGLAVPSPKPSVAKPVSYNGGGSQ